MTTFKDRARSTSKRLVAKYGRAAVFIEVVARDYNEQTMTATETPVERDVMIVLDYPKTKSYVPGDIVQAEGVPVLMDASGDANGESFVPKNGDRIRFGGHEYTITGVTEAPVEDGVALYQFQAGA